MFNRDTAMYLQKVYPAVETVDQEERRIMVLEFMVQPFTIEMATELGIQRHLFAKGDSTPMDDVTNITVKIAMSLQQLEFRPAPDVEKASVILRAVEVEPSLKVRRDKEGPVFAATLICSVRYPAADELLYVLNGYRRQHYLTFSDEQGDMLQEAEAERPKGRRRRVVEEEPALPGTSEQAEA